MEGPGAIPDTIRLPGTIWGEFYRGSGYLRWRPALALPSAESLINTTRESRAFTPSGLIPRRYFRPAFTYIWGRHSGNGNIPAVGRRRGVIETPVVVVRSLKSETNLGNFNVAKRGG